jgi:hypothetical protein
VLLVYIIILFFIFIFRIFIFLIFLGFVFLFLGFKLKNKIFGIFIVFMDFVKVTDEIDLVQEDQAEHIGFIENNKYYNSSFNSNAQNKRVYPSVKKIAPGNGNKKDSKKVTYDDILSSLNMNVVNGKLQIVRGDADVLSSQQKTIVNHRKQLNTNVKTNVNAYSKQNEFYNKFLQAQNQAYQAPVVDPLTPEEKKRLLMIQYIKQQQERQHIMRVKSRKMNFV